MEDKLRVGIISSTHGVRGEVKVFPTTDDVKRFSKLKRVSMVTDSEEILLEIQGVKYFKKFAIIKFKDYDNINEIEKYKGCELYIERSQAVPLKKDEYFITDLIGLEVLDEQEEVIGILKDVIETGANDVYVVERKEKGDLLLPAIKQCILNIDLAQQKMYVHIMDGLV